MSVFRNAFRCRKCGMIVESKSVHDFQKCKCGNYTDGGTDYIHRGGNFADMEDLSVTTIFGHDILPMEEVVDKVWEWFEDKNLHDPVMQMVKVQEEVGELAHEIARGRYDSFEAVDSLGDALVTIIGMCHHLNIPPATALSLAYAQIKDRKGQVVNNSFVKEEDASL